MENPKLKEEQRERDSKNFILLAIAAFMFGLAAVIYAITGNPIFVTGSCQGGGCTVGAYREKPTNQYDVEMEKLRMERFK